MDNYSGLRTNLTMLMDFYEITSFDDMYDFDYPMYALTFSSNSRSFFYRKS